MKTRIWGESDDIIRVHNDVLDAEFQLSDFAIDMIALSDGTLLSIERETERYILFSINLEHGDKSKCKIQQYQIGGEEEEYETYSDVAILSGNIQWAVHSTSACISMS